MYAVYHGPEGLTAIARRAHRYAAVLAAGLRAAGVRARLRRRSSTPSPCGCPGRAAEVWHAARAGRASTCAWPTPTRCRIVLRRDHHLRRPAGGVERVRHRRRAGARAGREHRRRAAAPPWRAPATFLTHPVFHAHRSETAMLRYLRAPLGPGRGAGPLDDPARLLHDEAERHHRDGADHLARVRATCTPSRRWSRPAGT